ncbi:MAG: efflux RND transporter permease subunit, partial [Pseudomonadales bacterium]
MKKLDALVRYSLGGQLPLWIFISAIVMGAFALYYTAREEEPQIVVPMIDVRVEAPGLSAQQVARQVTTPLEKLLAQIPGVEHVYSMSTDGMANATLRFYVGEDREESILNTYNKLYSNQDKIPPVVSNWMLKPVEVDDVPILLISLWSENPDKYDDFELRRLADEMAIWLQGIPQTSEVNVVGGRPRKVQIQISPESLAARKTTPLDVINA